MALNTTVEDTRVSDLTKKKLGKAKETFNLLYIGGTCIMRIYLLGRRSGRG